MIKQNVIDTICALPEDVTMEQIMYCLYVIDGHNKALADIKAGKVYSSDEVRNSIIKPIKPI